ncbi:MAG: four helix bundle protein [Tepidisphaeraceae bacterium]
MTEAELIDRTKEFALRVLKLIDALPSSKSGHTIGWQLSRSATSVAANYRAACRGRSVAEFAAKLGVVEEEADESAFWLQLVIEANLLKRPLVQPLYDEATQLTKIMAASRKTLSRNESRRSSANRKSQIANRKSSAVRP